MTSSPSGHRTILLAEDDLDIRDFVAMALEGEGYDVAAAANGQAALEAARAQPIDLILLDLAMPLLDGPEFCRAYRAEGGRAAVVLLTAASPDKVAVGMEACGAVAYLLKPFTIDALLDTVTQHLVPP